jgi:hypothetical protein
MTAGERAAPLEAYGFTPRQAAFLATVLLHGGVCVPRQYCAFAGITRGQVVQDFFDRLTARRFATVYPCARKGSHVYHLHHKALYRAIGEPESRYRRRASVERALERLMILDAVLMKRELTWLATERDKVTYCRQDRNVSEEELPRLIFEGSGSRTVRYFPEKLPLGVSDASDEVALLYLVTEPTGRLFRTFLEAHTAILKRLSRWRIVLVVPRVLATAEAAHRAAVTDLCATPLRPAVVDEFRWFCGVRRAVEEGVAQRLAFDAARYGRARRAFSTPRFFAAYREWLRGGDPTLGRLLSPAFSDAWRAGTAALETLVLPYVYADLSPVVQTA